MRLLLTTIAAAALALTLLLSKLQQLALHLSTLLPGAASAWRVEILYPTLIRLLASAITTIILLRVLGVLCLVVRNCIVVSRRRTATKRTAPPPKPFVYVYTRVRLYVDPATAPAHVRDSRCAVCLEEGSSDVVLSCKHVFHWDCVRPWLDAKNACPLCKRAQARRGLDREGRVVE